MYLIESVYTWVFCLFRYLCLLIVVFWLFLTNIIIEMVEGRNMILKDIHFLTLKTNEYVTLHDKKYFEDVIKINNIETGWSSWIIWVGPSSSHKSCKAENLSQV